MNEEQLDEPQANMYNARKPWHDDVEVKEQGSADSMFYQNEQEATSDDATPQEQTRTNYKKRYDDLKKHYDQKLSEFKQREEELQAMAQSAIPEYTPPKSVEDLERFKNEYPDLYDTVETVAHLRSAEQLNTLQEKLSVLEKRELEVSKRDAETKLKERHPDFDEIRGDEQFHEWAKIQPEEIQRWIYKNPDNADLASRAIDIYKMENNIAFNQAPRQLRTSQSTAADMVSTKTTTVDSNQPKVWTAREISALSMDEYDRFEEEIDRAVIEGRVIK